MTTPATVPVFTAEQRQAFLTLLHDEPGVGHIAALRRVGVQGTKGQLRLLLDDELLGEARERRAVEVRRTLYEMATNPEHPSCQRAAALWLKAYDPDFRDVSRRELTGPDGGPIALLAGRFDPELLSREELLELRGLLEKSRQELPAGERI